MGIQSYSRFSLGNLDLIDSIPEDFEFKKLTEKAASDNQTKALGYLTFPIVQRLRPGFDIKDESKGLDDLLPPPPLPPPKKGRHKVAYNQDHRFFGDVMSSPTAGESASAAEEE